VQTGVFLTPILHVPAFKHGEDEHGLTIWKIINEYAKNIRIYLQNILREQVNPV
jgi:hypothetical protein